MGMELGTRMLRECFDFREAMSWVEKLAQRGMSSIYFRRYIILANKIVNYEVGAARINHDGGDRFISNASRNA
jgi:hypothetical protein